MEINNVLIAVTCLCIVLGGMSKAVMDTIRFHFTTSVFKKYATNTWVNPALSWKNKYKGSKLMTLLFSTVLVWTTDCWHFCQHLMYMFIFGAMVPMGFVFRWWYPIVAYALFTIVFETFFKALEVDKS